MSRRRDGRRFRLARFAAFMITVVLLVLAAAEIWLVTDGIRHGVTTAVGIDVNQYLAHTQRWLHGGSWYLPAQLAGPYVVESIEGNVYPPTLLYRTVPFALGLPMVLWYAVPMAIVALTYWRYPPAWWAWPILGAVLVYPRTYTVIVLGNPALWAIALAVAGVRWGWPAWGATLKLTFAPLALVGLRSRRAWLVAGVATIALALPFGALWTDYLRVLLNTQSNRGVVYVLGEWPIAVGLMVVAASGVRRPLQAAGGEGCWRTVASIR